MEQPAEHLDASRRQKATARYVIVALFSTASSEFCRREWPAHVTLASNFVTQAGPDEVMNAVRRVIATSSLVIEFGGRASFGPNRDVPVQLVVPGPIIELHHALADLLQALPGFRAEDPAYWREGYRPHLTLGVSIAADEGTRRRVTSIALARLDGDIGTVLDVVPLASVPAHPG